MPFTTIAWAESQDAAAAWVKVAGVPDTSVSVSGDDIYCPSLTELIVYGAACEQTVASQARFTSPSMLEFGFEEYVSSLASGLTFAALPQVTDKRQSPVSLTEQEAIQAELYNNPGSAAYSYHFASLSDTAITPVTGAAIRTVRCTAAAALSAGTWASSSLTFPVSLRAGNYQCVGARCNSTNGVVFRLLFQGSPWRPGGVVVNDEADQGTDWQRQGGLGIWGEFDSRTTPQIEVLGITDSAQEVFLDLIYLG
ncbi:hypothetical protein CMI37_29465 [Candidatus Pacearchaeota archaeon]|nr:hypothetical protein [Candidatus Pacearchaeota archaeon]